MPTYDYKCEANGLVLEVSHRMSEEIHTWGELCTKTHREVGNTPSNSPVRRLATGGNVVSSSNLGGGNLPPCASGGGCPGGSCGI